MMGITGDLNATETTEAIGLVDYTIRVPQAFDLLAEGGSKSLVLTYTIDRR